MSKVYHTKRIITAASATSEDVGYEATNIALEAIGHPWRSTSIAVEQTVVLEFDSAAAVAVVLNDVNFASCVVKNAADVTLGTLTTYTDKITGRRRGIFAAAIATTTQIKLVIAAGTPTDDAAAWNIGAGYIYGEVQALPQEPAVGATYRAIIAQLRTDLPNKKIARAFLGDDVLEVKLPFIRKSTEDGLALHRLARIDTVALALELALYPEFDGVPVQSYEEAVTESFLGGPMSGFELVLREIT